MSIELFKHNEIAYEKLKKALENSKCTTINHATGTGKSFIALKYLYENRDKKYLYLAPTYPIIEQLLADCYKLGITPKDLNIDTLIYRSLLEMNMDDLYQKYDGIIFDEYHRTGARETYKKIKQLKLNLQKENDSKKFIGLTATPIRYLDNERNMTQEIFDNNVASNISLAEAMLEELLPVPIYINSKISCREDLNKAKTRIKKLSPSAKKHSLEEKVKKIEQKIDNGAVDNKEMINKYIKERNGKYIIFCPTIDALENLYKEVDTWFSKFGKIKKYKVYSDQQDIENKEKGIKQRNSKEVNQSNLDRFNNEEEGISVLLCVDILNEGVHVDGIDGVILLRKTTSPIIYFQQIGRALSFSGRHKQIKIFDLVNNFDNHNAIESIYEEFQEEMKKNIELHPEKAKQYKSILDRFKIMDETKEIIKEINTINEQTTQDEIIASKIDYSINLLKQKIEEDRVKFSIFVDDSIKNSYMTIKKYYKYVDNEQFEKLKNLQIILPEELSMSIEERKELLKGYSSLKEKEENESYLNIEQYIEFIEKNGRKPELNIENLEEKNLYLAYLNLISYFNNGQKEKIRQCMESNNIKFESWEKVLLGKKIYGRDIENIIETSYNYINNNQILPNYIQNAITQITLNYNIKENEQLFLILEKSEKIENEYKAKREKERFETLSKIGKFLEENETLNWEDLKRTGIVDEILKLRPSDRNYLKEKYTVLKKKQYKKFIQGEKDLAAFCKRMQGVKKDEFEDLFSSIEEDKKMYVTLNGIIEFMVKNEGKLPDSESDDELEKKLANELKKYIDSGKISSDIDSLQVDMQSEWYSPEQLMFNIIIEKYNESNIKLVILKNIEFFNKNGHRALKNSQDEEERNIAIEYEEKCIEGMSKDKLDMLNRIFNNKKSLQRTCQAYIQNKKVNKEER